MISLKGFDTSVYMLFSSIHASYSRLSFHSTLPVLVCGGSFRVAITSRTRSVSIKYNKEINRSRLQLDFGKIYGYHLSWSQIQE